ncbi:MULTISPECIES: hypothetical protein [Dinoroseobacter]|jgi:phosphate/sulfate permease|uniref:hypothetical protein n=1 Tax=Dinoroseobacter TaxID=309512 RepID=UPI0012FF52F4|nr:MULTISPECIES: hypothetical protein [Dinoroseobacter]MDD9715534.1 hypothetical protein [Dinoroseobacter sp. PD6]URF48287.1 hypothetical protein M8008_08410 [Dinoroseobacter shibae]URF52597.1 hypothetical protein M8007_08410 [Dinoroseobacter shibae]
MKPILLTACVAGVFCASFAWVVSALTNALSMAQALALAGVSGFLGSLVGQIICRRGEK